MRAMCSVRSRMRSAALRRILPRSCGGIARHFGQLFWAASSARVQIFRRRMRQLAERFARRRVDDRLRLAATAGHPLAGDEQFQLRVGSGLGNRRVAGALSLIRLTSRRLLRAGDRAPARSAITCKTESG